MLVLDMKWQRLDLDKNFRRNNIFLLSEKKIRSLKSWLINIYKLLLILILYKTKIPMIVETLYLSAKSNNQKGKKDSNIKFPNYIRWIILSNTSNILDGVETSATFW